MDGEYWHSYAYKYIYIFLQKTSEPLQANSNLFFQYMLDSL